MNRHGGIPAYPEQMLRPGSHVSIQRVEGGLGISHSWDCLNASPFTAGSARLRVSDSLTGLTLVTGANTPVPASGQATLSLTLPIGGFSPGLFNITLTMEDSAGNFIDEHFYPFELDPAVAQLSSVGLPTIV